MAFENLATKIQMSLRRITGRATLNEKDIDLMMKEIRLSLLEADVNFKVVRDFTAEVKQKAIGENILKSLKPGDQVVKVVFDELKKLMGDETAGVVFKPSGVSTFMLVGLQGAGKTTHCGKLALFLRKRNAKKPLLVATDVYRPAAIDQLKKLGSEINVPVFSLGTNEKPQTIVKKALEFAKKEGNDLVIIDTAGRLHIDETLMRELQDIEGIAKPEEVLLTIDAMMGQDAINVIKTFNEKLKLTGCIITKLDGDTRGGVALSVRYLTDVPVKFIGVGERIDQIDLFHPERMASRILGMGDVLTLVEKAQEAVDEEEAEEMLKKMKFGSFNYNDFLKQLKWLKRMGSLKGLLKLIPGVPQEMKNTEIGEEKLLYPKAIIQSMTEKERTNPDLISRSPSRRERIAKGSGRPYPEVNKLVKQFEDMRKQMQMLSGMNEEDMASFSKKLENYQQNRKVSKGKGKGKGAFRF